MQPTSNWQPQPQHLVEEQKQESLKVVQDNAPPEIQVRVNITPVEHSISLTPLPQNVISDPSFDSTPYAGSESCHQAPEIQTINHSSFVQPRAGDIQTVQQGQPSSLMPEERTTGVIAAVPQELV
jgi:hypothetical protein